MALTATQKANVRLYLGWSARFHQFDSRLEQAMSALDTEPEHEAQFTALLTAEPPGFLAALGDIDTKLRGSDSRLKASKVGTITLNAKEQNQLRRQGRQYITRMASILGAEIREDYFGNGNVTTFAGHGGKYGGSDGNYIGK